MLLTVDEQKQIIKIARRHVSSGNLEGYKHPKNIRLVHLILNLEVPTKDFSTTLSHNHTAFDNYISNQPRLKETYSFLFQYYKIFNERFLQKGISIEERRLTRQAYLSQSNKIRQIGRLFSTPMKRLKHSSKTPYNKFRFFEPEEQKNIYSLGLRTLKTSSIEAPDPLANIQLFSSGEGYPSDFTPPSNLFFVKEDPSPALPFGHLKYKDSGEMLPLEPDPSDVKLTIPEEIEVAFKF